MSSIVVFSLKDERYGVPIEKVREILPLMKVTSVPGTPHYFKGFLNVRGELISLIDLRKFAG
ncbi:MAG TPA: chemotaxis protein CheW, partial [Thermovirga lienii]|nr:chemotaxis protein CheW [Thermovirga lienii]